MTDPTPAEALKAGEPTPAEIIAFLNGERPLEDKWFADPYPASLDRRQAFWWRKYLPLLTTPATDAGEVRKDPQWADDRDPMGDLAIKLAARASAIEEQEGRGEWTWREIAECAAEALGAGEVRTYRDIAPPAVRAEPNDDDHRTAVAVLLVLNPSNPDIDTAARLIAAYRVACLEGAARTPAAAIRGLAR